MLYLALAHPELPTGAISQAAGFKPQSANPTQAKQEAGEEAEADLSDEGASEAGGFIFSKLIQRKPHLKPELLTFRDTLLASSSQEQTLKVDLSFKPYCPSMQMTNSWSSALLRPSASGGLPCEFKGRADRQGAFLSSSSEVPLPGVYPYAISAS